MLNCNEVGPKRFEGKLRAFRLLVVGSKPAVCHSCAQYQPLSARERFKFVHSGLREQPEDPHI